MSPKLNPMIRILLVVIALVVAATGCKKDASDSPDSSPTPASVKFQVVTAQIQLAGLLGALSQDYFQDENITAELLFSEDGESADPLDVISQVENGEAEFGLTPAENLLVARERGDDVVALMSIYQRDPTAIVSLPYKNITTPADLRGKTLLVFSRSTSLTLFLNAVGLDPSEVTTVEPPNGDVNAGIASFLSGQVDGIVATGTDAAAQMQVIGIQPNLIFFNEYGIEMYPNVVFTTQRMINEHPDVVQRCVNAILRGLQYAVEQPEALATWFVEHYGDQLSSAQLNSQDEAMVAIIPLIQSSTSKPGMMNAAVWDTIVIQLSSIGIIQNSLSAANAYTLRFVEAYYH